MKDLVSLTTHFVRERLSGDATGHDFWHIRRVSNLAERIARREGADLTVVRLAALLHDIADWKFHKGDASVGPKVARGWLEKQGADQELVSKVCAIIADVSFKGAGVKRPVLSLEGRVVQDADRLDALGAIGIARAFAYGGAKGRAMHDPAIKPRFHKSARAYLKAGGTTLNHFYEKLLLLKARMNTPTGRKMAQHRHAFMEGYVRRFLAEWDGKS